MPGVSLRPPPAFNPDTPRRLSTPLLTPFNSTPTFVASYPSPKREAEKALDEIKAAFDARLDAANKKTLDRAAEGDAALRASRRLQHQLELETRAGLERESDVAVELERAREDSRDADARARRAEGDAEAARRDARRATKWARELEAMLVEARGGAPIGSHPLSSLPRYEYDGVGAAASPAPTRRMPPERRRGADSQ